MESELAKMLKSPGQYQFHFIFTLTNSPVKRTAKTCFPLKKLPVHTLVDSFYYFTKINALMAVFTLLMLLFPHFPTVDTITVLPAATCFLYHQLRHNDINTTRQWRSRLIRVAKQLCGSLRQALCKLCPTFS